MSSKLSKRRATVRKPKICVSAAAAQCPPPPPPPPCTCRLEPDEETIFSTETWEPEIYICCPYLETGLEISVEAFFLDGGAEIETPATNCENPGTAIFDPWENVGDFPVRVEFSDGINVICTAHGLLHSIEENGNGNGNGNGK